MKKSYLGVLILGIATLKQILSPLNGLRTFVQWKTKLENNYNNNTEAFLNNVFDYAIFSMYNHQNWPNN